MMRFSIKSLAVLCFAAILMLPTARAEKPAYVTDWNELLPAGLYDFFPEEISSSLWFDPVFQKKIEKAERQIRHEVNNSPIFLPGYMVPLVYEGEDVYEFLLVPSAGQCIHVPPPPVNQTIYVALEKPTRIRTYGEPVIAEGVLTTVGAITDYAETGYRIEAKSIHDFSFDLWEGRLEEIEGSK